MFKKCSNCEGGKCMGNTCEGKKCPAAKISKVLLVIGGLNWGLVGLGGFIGINLNIVNLIFGGMPVIEWIVYILVGLAAVAFMFGCHCNKCKDMSAEAKM